jgi:hypothetical protein
LYIDCNIDGEFGRACITSAYHPRSKSALKATFLDILEEVFFTLKAEIRGW